MNADELKFPGSWKPVAVGIIAALALLAGTYAVGYLKGSRAQETQALKEAKAQEERAKAAEQRETQATAQAAADGALAARLGAEKQALQAKLNALPPDPGPRPVPADASAEVVVAGLQSLGLNPRLLGDGPALGLSLPDGRTTLNWGREAQRVGPLVARLDTSMALVRAQEGHSSALLSQVSDLTTALGACDDRATAQERRAQALERALAARVDRPWYAGALVAIDTQGARHYGGYVGRGWGPVQAQVQVIGNYVAIGAGIRF